MPRGLPSELTWILPWTPVLSIRLATLTVFPQMSYCGLRAPITPATTGPTLMPGNSRTGRQWGGLRREEQPRGRSRTPGVTQCNTPPQSRDPRASPRGSSRALLPCHTVRKQLIREKVPFPGMATPCRALRIGRLTVQAVGHSVSLRPRLPLPERTVARRVPWMRDPLSSSGCRAQNYVFSGRPCLYVAQGPIGLDSDTGPRSPRRPCSQVWADATAHLLTRYSASTFLSLAKRVNTVSDAGLVNPPKPGQWVLASLGGGRDGTGRAELGASG